MSKTLDTIKSIFNKYKIYDYIDLDISNYHIKSLKEFNILHGGVCWDFVIPIARDLSRNNIKYRCYFTGIHRYNKMVGSHTYIIVEDGPFHYWIECSWQRNKYIFMVSSYKDVEQKLKKEYRGTEVHTVIYNPFRTIGMAPNEFFEYLENEGIDLS